MMTALVSEVIETHGGTGRNCARTLTISPCAYFGIAATKWLYSSDNIW